MPPALSSGSLRGRRQTQQQIGSHRDDTVTGCTGMHPLQSPEHPFLLWCPHRPAPAPRDPPPRVSTLPWDAPALQNREWRKEKGGTLRFYLENIISGCTSTGIQQGPSGPAELPPMPSPTGGQHSPTCSAQGPSLLGHCICHRSLSS